MSGEHISIKKQNLMMKLTKMLFDPEIVFEDDNILQYIAQTPCVIICNHSRRTRKNKLTSCDGPVVRYAFSNRQICSLMAADLMKNPFFGTVVRGCNCIPVSRDAASTDWIHKCQKKLNEGCSVVIFPEGTTFKEKDVDLFKPGFALLAGITDVPVIPVAISGIYKPFTKKKIKIKIGTPTHLSITNKTKSGYEKETLRFKRIIETMHADINTEHRKVYSV